MVENFAKWPSERGQTAKVRSSEACEGMEFPWRWISGTIFTNLDVIWGMSVSLTDCRSLLRSGSLRGPPVPAPP